MNRYGRIAQRYWTTYLPSRVAALPNPVGFFADLGEEIEDMVLSLEDDLAGPDIPRGVPREGLPATERPHAGRGDGAGRVDLQPAAGTRHRRQ